MAVRVGRDRPFRSRGFHADGAEQFDLDQSPGPPGCRAPGVTFFNGRGGAVALEQPANGGVAIAQFLAPEDVNDPATMMQCGRLRDALARDVFPSEAVALQICRGPMAFGPGDLPVRDVVVTLR